MQFYMNTHHYYLNKCTGQILIRKCKFSVANTKNVEKMQDKGASLFQWKFTTYLKNYLFKFLNDNTFENVLNKEFAQFLQRVQPTVYGTDIVRYFQPMPDIQEKNETAGNFVVEKKEINTRNKSVHSHQRLIPNVLINDLKIRTTSEKDIRKVAHKWKNTKVVNLAKESVISRTNQILTFLSHTKSNYSKLEQIKEFNDYINTYPEARHGAVKEGAIRQLLKMRFATTSEEIRSTINESLALLGYVHPIQSRGIRILSIDGGGVRGILVIEMLKKLEELTGKSVHEMFDLICGVSTGAIIASLIGVKQSSLNEISDVYKNISTQIFTQSTLKGTSNLVWSHSYYDTPLWEKLLKEQIGEQTLISTSRDSKCPKLCVLSAVVNQTRLSAYIFRNYALPYRVQSQYMGSHSHQIWEAVRASAAAPTYFEEFKLGNMLHQDGGILFNNPTAVAIHEAKLLWPQAHIQCVMSFGTGRTIPTPMDIYSEQVMNSSWRNKFYAIVESATDTEGVHTMLSDLLPENVYYRFNPYLTEMLDIAEIDPKKIKQLKRDALMYLRRNEDKFHEAAHVLNTKKTVTQKTVDWFNRQKEIYMV